MKITCPRCKGKGYYEAKIKNLATLDYNWHTVACDATACENGIVDMEKYYAIVLPKNTDNN